MARNMNVSIKGDTMTITVNLNPKKVVLSAKGTPVIAQCFWNDFQDELPEGLSMNFVLTKKKARTVKEVDESEDDAPAPKKSSTKKAGKSSSKPSKKPKASAPVDKEDGEDNVFGGKRQRRAA